MLNFFNRFFRIVSLKKSLYPFFFLLLFSCTPPDAVQKEVDAIIHKSYKDIYDLYSVSKELEEKIFYGTIFLKKAKAEKNNKYILAGYRILSITYEDERVLKFCDSIIALTKSNSDKNYPAIAYEKKGDYYFKKRIYKRALDNYLNFLQFSAKHNNKLSVSRATYNVGTLKRRIGDLDGALQLFRENFYFTKKYKDSINHNTTYLNSISALASIFNDVMLLDSAAYYNDYGIKESIKLKDDFYYSHFALNEGITSYHEKKYLIAIDSLEKHIPYNEKMNNFIDLPYAYYYTGEAYLAVHNEEKAMEYFKKVDTIFQKTQSLFPIIRKTYLQLDNYYKKKGDNKSRVVYLDQLLKVDSILKSDELYLNKKIVNEYDIPKIKAEKESIVKEISIQKNILKNTVIILSVFILGLIIALKFQYRKKKIYKKRFQDIINNKDPVNAENMTPVYQKTFNVPSDIVENILSDLERFEKKEEFISNTITLNSLAKKLNTNPNYLSKVINYHKQASFTNYLNSLRIDFCVRTLKENPTYLKYTIKAISDEVGFNNVQSFSKAFYNSKGIKPSYFIKELKKVRV